jgi:hypothetical protein
MLDFLRKQVVATFEFSNVAMNRNFEKKVLVNGRTATMTCAAPIAVMEGALYKVYDHSVKSFKYVLHVGIGEQDVHDNIKPDVVELREKAVENMLISPVITMTFDELNLREFNFDEFCMNYLKIRKPVNGMMNLHEVHADDKKTAYGRKYPYDWAYFKIYRRNDI